MLGLAAKRAVDLFAGAGGMALGFREAGYEIAVADLDNPFFPAGTRLVGHEFHYSRVIAGGDRARTVLRVERGTGVGEQRDGITSGRVFASYLHLHAGATPGWADGFLALASRYAGERGTSTAACG